MRTAIARLPLVIVLLGAVACAGLGSDDASQSAMRYRLTESGEGYYVSGTDRVLEDLRPRYPEFFDVILNPEDFSDFDLRPIRRDLESEPVDRSNYDALNAIAIAYFEINERGEALRGTQSMSYMSQGFRAAKLLSVPWRAYGEIEDGELRDAILDFFADVASGEKTASRATAGRLLGIVASLEQKEADAQRLARIRDLVERIRAQRPPGAPDPRF